MSAAQTYRERPPAARLAPYVSSVWVQQVTPDHAAYTHRTVPNGAAEVRCVLGSEPRIVGPQTVPRVDVLTPGTTVVGVRLRREAGPAVLGMPMTELVDLSVDAGELLGPGLGETLAGCRSPADALEGAIIGLLDDAGAPDPIVAETVRGLMPGGIPHVGTLARRLYVCERQLRRRCLAVTGLAPKALHRMLRFQGFLALAHAAGLARVNLAELALRAGYADQAHLSRECLRLAGVSPRTLLHEAARDCAGAHDHTPSYRPLLAATAA